MFTSADYDYIQALKTIIEFGDNVSARGMETLELLGFQTQINMEHCVVALPNRLLGYKFMAAEAAWILSGDNRVATIEPYTKKIVDFSDDGVRYFGSYGPKVIDQLSYVVETLSKDLGSRQALINIWREQPRPTKDVPCTVSLQFLVRNGQLNCVDTMRSSDIWLGWPYDIFNMSMISLGIILMLKKIHGIDLKLGTLILNAGSQHLYKYNATDAEKLLNEYDVKVENYEELETSATSKYLLDYDGLVDLLWSYAKMTNSEAKIRLVELFG